MMSPRIALGPLLLLLLTPCFGQSDAAASHSWHAFAALDYLAPGNQSKRTEGEAANTCSQLTALGAGCGASSSNYGAWGGRLGALHRAGRIEAGGTLGYLYGGPQNSSKRNIGVTNISGPGASSHSVWNNTLRPMIEARERLTPFANLPSLQFVMGEGAGVAVDWESQDCSSSGSLILKCGSAPPAMGWGTWEVSPSVVYRDFELGVRYAGFSRGRQIPWNTWGAFLAYTL